MNMARTWQAKLGLSQSAGIAGQDVLITCLGVWHRDCRLAAAALNKSSCFHPVLSNSNTPSTLVVSDRMVADPRISDRELAAINAAAVTKEYRVQPHLGKIKSYSYREMPI